MKNKNLQRNTIFWLSALGSLLVALVVVLGVSFFKAIIDSQVESKREFLSQQTALASRGLEIELERFEAEFNSFFGLLQLQRDTPEESKVNLGPNARRLINMFPKLIDSVWVDMGDEVYFFTLTSRNDLVSRSSGISFPAKVLENQFLATEPNSPIRVLFSTNLRAFTNEYASNFYLAPGGRKFLMQHNSQVELGLRSSKPITISEADLNLIFEDISSGLKGIYEVTWTDDQNNEVQGVLAQYPVSFSFTQGQVSLVFVIPTEGITSGIYSAYILFFLGIVILLVLTATFFVFSLKNSLKSKREIESNLYEISTLFEQQNLLLKELRGFVFFHDKSGKITKVSEEVTPLIGLSKEEFFHSFSGDSDFSVYQLVKSEIQKAIAEGQEFVNLEVDLTHAFFQRDIRLRIFEKLFYDGTGKFLGGMGICTDITESYQAGQEIQNSEIRLRNLIRSIPDTIFIYDNHGKIVDQPIQGSELSDSPDRDFLATHILDITDEGQREEIWKTFQEARRTGKIHSTHFSLLTSKGSIRHFEIRFFPLDEHQMMSISKDITGQKVWEKGLMDAMKAADQASQAKSQFLANMSHEIRTPMNGLLGIIDLLENTSLNPIQKQYLDIIKNSGNSLLNIIKDILDYSKIESGKIEILEETFDPATEIQTQIEIVSGLAKKKNIDLNLTTSSRISRVLIRADRIKINQVLLNLVGNAIKFTPEGGKVEVVLRVEDEGGGLYHLSYLVKDSGIGIKEEFIDRLTEPFFQVDSSSSRTFQGTGLGLAIAKKMIDLMGGKLTIKSTPGLGSEFLVEVWVGALSGQADHPVKKELVWKEIKEKGMEYPLRILLVEDNDLNLQLMRMMFEQLGFQFDVAKNGRESLEMIRQKLYDIVLMDVQMPVLNGIDATREIRKDPLNKDLFIIGLSANVFEEDEKKAREAGMDDYLTKPIRLAVLAEKLDFFYRKVIDRKT